VLEDDDLVERIEAATCRGRVLKCAECGARSSGRAVGWRAHIGYDVRDGEPPEVFVFCPECAELSSVGHREAASSLRAQLARGQVGKKLEPCPRPLDAGSGGAEDA
jgi:hypothetical protein